MDKDHLKHHVRIIAGIAIGMESDLKRLDLLELEILAVKTSIQSQRKSLRSAICSVLGMFEGEGLANWDFGFDTDYQSHIPTLQLNQESNEYQEIVSKPTATVKSVEEIIREVKEMIIELQIKGSVREHRNGLLKFHNTVFGSIYGHTKEEIEKQLKEKIKQFKNKPQKDKKEKSATPLLSVFYRSEYLPYKIADGIAAKTIEGYESRINFIVKQKFDKPLNLYKAKDIESFLYSFPQTRKRQILQGFFNNVFQRAITAGYIKNNPCDTVEKVKHKQEQGTAFSFVELKEFLQILFKIEHLSYADKCYFIFVFLTGTRRDEARLLKVSDVDFENKILHIPGTKTDGSDRDIPLNPLVEKLLLSMSVKKGRYFNLAEHQADIRFRKVWEKKKGHKLHDLRHTFGTIQICVEKIDVKTVSLWMGHSTVDTTLNRYTHPEQLDKGTFLNGSFSATEKVAIYKHKHDEIMTIVDRFLG